jgi:hypothetical protein
VTEFGAWNIREFTLPVGAALYPLLLVVLPRVVGKMKKDSKRRLFSDFMMSKSCLDLLCSVMQFCVLVVVTAIFAAL